MYQEITEKKHNGNVIPDANENRVFWSNIWYLEKSHDNEEERFNLLKEKKYIIMRTT